MRNERKSSLRLFQVIIFYVILEIEIIKTSPTIGTTIPSMMLNIGGAGIFIQVDNHVRT